MLLVQTRRPELPPRMPLADERDACILDVEGGGDVSFTTA